MREKRQICNLEGDFGIGTFMLLSMGLLLNSADLGDLKSLMPASDQEQAYLFHRSDPFFFNLLLLYHFDSLLPSDIPNCE